MTINFRHNIATKSIVNGISTLDVAKLPELALAGAGSAILTEHERTEFGFSSRERVDGGAGEVMASAVASPEPPQQNPLPTKRVTRIVGFAKLKALLQPIHSYFQDKLGFIKQFSVYKDLGCDLVYPEVKVLHRNNPYRRHQLTHRQAAKTYRRVRQFVDNSKLDDFALACVTFTMPKFMSEYLASQGKRGDGMAWRLFDGLWNEDIPAVIKQKIDLGCHVNLHKWRTQVPVNAHYHFHTMIANYGLVESKRLDDDGEPCQEFKRWEWHRQRGGRVVPFSEDQLEELKDRWLERLQRFCKRHGIQFIEGKIDIYVEYIDAWVKFLHRLNYNGRHWSENYAEYSNDTPDCPAPPEWLLHYENKARVKGWWSNIKAITVEDTEKEKISPYTGENMNYCGKYSLASLLSRSGNELGYVEFVKGQPVEGVIDNEQLGWLKGVMYIREIEYEDDIQPDMT